jgi:hypothetical protein
MRMAYRVLRLFIRQSEKKTGLSGQCSETDQNDQPNQRFSERYGCDQIKLRPRSDHLLNAFFCGLIDWIEPIFDFEHTLY